MLRINIRKLRYDNNLSQEEFGKTIGVNKGSIQAYETGRCDPSLKTIKRIVDTYMIDDLYLFLFK